MKKTAKCLACMIMAALLLCLMGCGTKQTDSAGFAGEVDGVHFELPDLGTQVPAGEGKTVKISWEVSTGKNIVGYYLAVSETYEMDELYCGEITSDTFAELNSLQPGKTYYWKVIASVDGGSASSDPAWFTTAD